MLFRSQYNPRLADIRGIMVQRHPAWAHYHSTPLPTTYHEAQMSLPYSVAVALKEGAALLPQYSDRKLADPEIGRLAALVRIVPEPALPRGVSCRMSVETMDGRCLTVQVDQPKGSIENPMTRDEMDAKVHRLADGVLGEARVTRLIEIVGRIEDVKDMRDLTSVLVGGVC